ncbi:hypothetical protein EW146_g3207 [Bondarzewia mesenterica]|uniref:Uncharacterized protein n=1 Tax=Bondarzewia mesenterica TaxID=1095465 RepID=A0A4S4LY93_9AGAM|nr:hypothetical protein EW146_g3207 [Bondarzewia mesenterica]
MVTIIPLGGLETGPEDSLAMLKLEWQRNQHKLKLELTFTEKRARSQFNALEDLFSIGKKENESLQSLIHRIDEAMNEDITRTHRLEAFPPSDSTQAFVASSGTPGAGKKSKGSRQWFKCGFCSMNGHTDRYFKCINQQLQGKPSQANAIQEVPKLDSGIVQFTGSASLHSLHPSDPLLPLQLDADVDWNADTGATSHMTPHHHWLCSYKPHVIPVHLADSTVIYSAGIGSVVWKVIYTLHLKNEAFGAFKHYKAYTENATGYKMKSTQDGSNFAMTIGSSGGAQCAIGLSRMVWQSEPIALSLKPLLPMLHGRICLCLSGEKLWHLLSMSGIACPSPHSRASLLTRPGIVQAVFLRLSTRQRRTPGTWWQVKPSESTSVREDDHDDASSSLDQPVMSDGEKLVEEALMAEVERALFVASPGKAEPSSYRLALNRPDADAWQKAAEEEMDAHAHNGKHYKARLVANDFSHCPGFDYFETFDPTAKFAAIRAILALSAIEDFHLRSVDISHAFINGELDTKVYMEQPEGFEQGEPITSISLPVFVDDCTFVSNSAEILDKIVAELASTFRLRDLSPSTSILGTEIVRDCPNRCLSLSQCQYIIDMLQCYGFDDSSPVKMPILPGVRLSSDMSAKSDEDKEYMKKVLSPPHREFADTFFIHELRGTKGQSQHTVTNVEEREDTMSDFFEFLQMDRINSDEWWVDVGLEISQHDKVLQWVVDGHHDLLRYALPTLPKPTMAKIKFGTRCLQVGHSGMLYDLAGFRYQMGTGARWTDQTFMACTKNGQEDSARIELRVPKRETMNVLKDFDQELMTHTLVAFDDYTWWYFKFYRLAMINYLLIDLLNGSTLQRQWLESLLLECGLIYMINVLNRRPSQFSRDCTLIQVQLQHKISPDMDANEVDKDDAMVPVRPSSWE